MNDRDRLAPVTLSGEYPVTQLVVDSLLTDASGLDHRRSLFLQHCGLHTIPLAGVDHGSACLGISLGHVLDLFSILCDNLDDRDVKFGRKFEVTVIMGRYAHDRAGTIICQYIVRQPDRNLCAVDRIDGIASGKHAGLLFVLHTVYIGTHGGI